jgi:hypothetical protein
VTDAHVKVNVASPAARDTCADDRRERGNPKARIPVKSRSSLGHLAAAAVQEIAFGSEWRLRDTSLVRSSRFQSSPVTPLVSLPVASSRLLSSLVASCHPPSAQLPKLHVAGPNPVARSIYLALCARLTATRRRASRETRCPVALMCHVAAATENRQSREAFPGAPQQVLRPQDVRLETRRMLASAPP